MRRSGKAAVHASARGSISRRAQANMRLARRMRAIAQARPSTAEIIRALSRKESQMMKQIRDEISVVIKSRWN